MASRAPMIHQYPASGALRPRRDVWFRADEEPVVLPRRGRSGVNFTLLAAGTVAAALTFGAAYAVYGLGAPRLGPSEPASLTPTWTPDGQPVRAMLLERLNGREQAPSQPAPASAREPEPPASAPVAERELTGDEASLLSPPPETSFTIERPVKPDQPSMPAAPQRPETPVRPPYPNPTTTPPEIMPQDAPALPTPENPY